MGNGFASEQGQKCEKEKDLVRFYAVGKHQSSPITPPGHKVFLNNLFREQNLERPPTAGVSLLGYSRRPPPAIAIEPENRFLASLFVFQGCAGGEIRRFCQRQIGNFAISQCPLGMVR